MKALEAFMKSVSDFLLLHQSIASRNGFFGGNNQLTLPSLYIVICCATMMLVSKEQTNCEKALKNT